VSAGSTVSRELEFDIRLLPQHYWEPLEVTKNSPIIVDESTTIAITRQYLEVEKIYFLLFDFNLKLILGKTTYGATYRYYVFGKNIATLRILRKGSQRRRLWKSRK
jgi:hypothetical protein